MLRRSIYHKEDIREEFVARSVAFLAFQLALEVETESLDSAFATAVGTSVRITISTLIPLQVLS